MYRAGALPIEGAVVLQDVGKRSSRDVLHHQVMLIVNGQPGVHADDVGMLDLGHQVGVLAEGLQRLGLLGRRPAHLECLQCHDSRQIQVLGQPDLAERPSPQVLVDAVAWQHR